MATKKKAGKPVVIVESPAKARTIAKFLGNDYVIEASVGHIRDLPANAADVPAKFKKEKWSRLGIDVENDFAPLYVVPKDKRDHMKKLKQLVKEADVLFLATDEDREGESISWHLVEELKPKGEVKRLVFHEITKSAIQHALDNPREINQDLVEAQETRRLVDRLYGYSVSPLLWKKIKPRHQGQQLSAGRVQSVAIRLVVEREQERMRFVTADYWGIEGTFSAAGEKPFRANLASVAGARLAIGKDFDADNGQLKESKGTAITHLTEASARELVERLSTQQAKVESLEQKPYTERPQPPFTTSTLQQEVGRKLGFTAKRAMRAAQRLYENGYVTYMRTDSTTLSAEAIAAARTLIETEFGKENIPDEPRTYQTKVRNAQEAHEAIRPAGASFTDPKSLGSDMGEDERRVYELIFRRTVACQMKDAKGKRTTLTLAVDDARFTTSGRTIEFPGFRLAYVQQEEEPPAEGAGDAAGKAGSEKKAEDKLLPNVVEGQDIGTDELDPQGHTTKPPARLTEASLVRELEARGIGRPSTYASIIETIQQRGYVFKKGAAMVPSFTAFAVVNLLTTHLGYLVDYAFTAKMEDDLDEISNGKREQLDYLKGFFIGNGTPGLRSHLDKVDEHIDPRDVCTVRGFDLGEFDDEPIQVREGRYGAFLSCGEYSASLPEEFPPDELTRAIAVDYLEKAKAGPISLGSDPVTGLKVFVLSGRYGPYFQLGDTDSVGDEKPKRASLLADMDAEQVTLEEALSMLALPRNLGTSKQPDTDEAPGEEHEIKAYNGRFGPYLKWGKETRSIPKEDHLLRIDMKRALELFAQPKQRGRKQAQAAKALKELGEHPESKTMIKVFDGRYGPYVSDGEVNATIPKDEDSNGIGLARAIELIDARIAKGGGKKKKKKAAKKKTAKKKATKKKAAKKKATKKKAAAEDKADATNEAKPKASSTKKVASAKTTKKE